MKLHCIVLIIIFSSITQAKVINTSASSSYFTKTVTGISQATQWLYEWVTPSLTERKREPRKIKLLLAGLGRTGTTSFVTALKKLGYSPVHDDEATEISDVYRDMFSGAMTIPEANEEMGQRGFDAPAINLHKYIMWAATDPDIKVILTVRDAGRWAESFKSIVNSAFLLDKRPLKWIPAFQDLRDYNYEVVINVPTNGNPELYDDIPTLEAGFKAWNDFVVETIPSERLLVFNVKEGWKPLCEFLGKDIPDEPFPHINDRFVVSVILTVLEIITWVWPLLIVAPFAVVYYCTRRYFGKARRQKEGDDSKKQS